MSEHLEGFAFVAALQVVQSLLVLRLHASMSNGGDLKERLILSVTSAGSWIVESGDG